MIYKLLPRKKKSASHRESCTLPWPRPAQNPPPDQARHLPSFEPKIWQRISTKPNSNHPYGVCRKKWRSSAYFVQNLFQIILMVSVEKSRFTIEVVQNLCQNILMVSVEKCKLCVFSYVRVLRGFFLCSCNGPHPLIFHRVFINAKLSKAKHKQCKAKQSNA